MLREDRSWIKAPPSYPPIQTTPETHNLHLFKSMGVSDGPGVLYNCSEFLCQFTKK